MNNFDLDIFQQHIDWLNIESLHKELVAIENILNNWYEKPEGRLREKVKRITKKILELSSLQQKELIKAL